jgi:pyruvate/2-oxoacid:ferredoxin oxidoreductase beta subunit
LAVQSNVFPLYEVVNGKYNITVMPEPARPITDYFKPQGRFRHLSAGDVAQIQEKVTKDFEALKAKAACFPA